MLIHWADATGTETTELCIDASATGCSCHGTVSLTYDEPTAWVDDADPDESDRSEFELGQLGRGPAKQACTGRPYNAYVPIRQARQRERGIGHRNFRSRAEKGRQRWGRKRPR